MADIKDGGPAFPRPYSSAGNGNSANPQKGMSLRDYFAGQALAGLYASGPHDCGPDGLAHDAYLAADAMLAKRER